jgi:putative membrane protein
VNSAQTPDKEAPIHRPATLVHRLAHLTTPYFKYGKSAVSSSIAQQPMPCSWKNTGATMPIGGNYGYGWAGFFWMLFWILLWWALFGGLIWLMARSLHRAILRAGHREVRILSSEPSATEILRRRYARGELDDSTFERMRARLEASATSEEENQRLPVLTSK